METRRRRLLWGAAFFFVLLSAGADAEIQVALVDGEIELKGLTSATLASGAEHVRVSVAPDAPAILGEYRVRAGRLYFRPMFPFDRGRDYVVRVDAKDGKPFVTTVALPAGDRTPVTLVESVYPSTDTLPENQLKLYIHFSEPMAGGDGLVFVKLLNADGDEVQDPFLPLGEAFWDRDFRRYTVFFDPGRVKRGILPNEEMGRPILDGRRYALVLDASWRDANGLPLKEDYRKEFIAGPPDERPIDPEAWLLQTPPAGTTEPLIVDFPEPLDRSVLARTLTVEGVAGTIAITRDETRWSFTPASAWRAGEHRLVALTIMEDLAGNQIGKPFEVDVFERIDSPDDVSETHVLPFVIQR